MRNLKKLRKRSPFHRIGDSYASFFDPEHFLGRSAFEDNWLTKAPANVIQNDDYSYELEVALPGFSKDQINIGIDNDTLTIKADKELKMDDRNYILQEVPHERLVRTFKLAEDIDQESITAKYENGIVRLKVPHRRKATHATKSITIK